MYDSGRLVIHLSMIYTKPLKVVCTDAVLKIASTNKDVPASYSNL